MKKLIALILLTVGTSPVIHAQDTLRVLPGSKEILYSKIKPHVIKYRFTATRNGQNRDFGIYTDSVSFIKRGNKKLLVRYSFFPARNLYDTGFYYPENLVSISNSEYSSSGVMKLKYSADRVTGQHIQKPKDSLVLINEKMPTAFFDGYLNDFIPRYLNLKEGYVVKMPVYALGTKGITWITVSVLRSETLLAANSKNHDVWLVELRWPNFPTIFTLYVDKKSREVFKTHMKSPSAEIMKERIEL